MYSDYGGFVKKRRFKAHERERLEKLVRYMARPAISDERVIIEGPQSIRVKLKSRWSDG
ncbi:MAG: hypothetical protein RL189_1165, partial [Pseudomonadota bacterium]